LSREWPHLSEECGGGGTRLSQSATPPTTQHHLPQELRGSSTQVTERRPPAQHQATCARGSFGQYKGPCHRHGSQEMRPAACLLTHGASGGVSPPPAAAAARGYVWRMTSPLKHPRSAAPGSGAMWMPGKHRTGRETTHQDTRCWMMPRRRFRILLLLPCLLLREPVLSAEQGPEAVHGRGRCGWTQVNERHGTQNAAFSQAAQLNDVSTAMALASAPYIYPRA
jgi:hypothetical protein